MSDRQEDGINQGHYRSNLSCYYKFESQCSSGLLFRLNYLAMESCCDKMYVGNESLEGWKQVSGRISGDLYDYNNERYRNWTDLNGNTLVIIVQSNNAIVSGGFELEFKCSDQENQELNNQIDCYDGTNGGCSHHCNQVSSLYLNSGATAKSTTFVCDFQAFRFFSFGSG